ncbi:TPA: hypothetical protein ACX6QK_003962 [Photobacterium damselae]
MKVVIEFTEAGKYRDQAWEGSFLCSKGQLHAVTPSYAAQLIQQRKAVICMDKDGEIRIEK